jgi:hypothetical protein
LRLLKFTLKKKPPFVIPTPPSPELEILLKEGGAFTYCKCARCVRLQSGIVEEETTLTPEQQAQWDETTLSTKPGDM